MRCKIKKNKAKNMAICVKAMHQEIQIFVRSGRNRVSSLVTHINGIRQGSGLSACLFNSFLITL
jgi:hypothetical protein